MSPVLTRGRSRPSLHVGLVNNMPDAALAGTERQFAQLFVAAAPEMSIRFSLFSLDGIPRNEAGREHLVQNGYRGAWELPEAGLDALIVTGTEPKLPILEQEPYWPALARIFDWLEHDGPPVLFSCLAAHAAVQHFNGIRRRRLAKKCFGMFAHIRAGRSRLTEGLAPEAYVAHSRWNEISVGDLARCGYQILTFAPDAGANLFVREKRNTWLFFQGHPEYDPGALGREYHRDVRRYLAAERDAYPALPKNYFSTGERALLAAFAERALILRDERLMEEFPVPAHSRGFDKGWQAPGGAGVIGMWLKQIADAKLDTATFGRADRVGSLVVSQP